jgi:hypothetical protein
VLRVFANSLGSSNIPQDLQVEMVNMVKSLLQQFGTQIEQTVQSLSAEEQQNLKKFLA